MAHTRRMRQVERVEGLSENYLRIFITSYMETALWASTAQSDDSGGKSLDQNYSIEDIAEPTFKKMAEDCVSFVKHHKALLDAADVAGRSFDAERAGHDFWLSRNGHGAGFFDEGLGHIGDELQRAAKVYGSFDLYIGDDGQIHGS